MSGRKQHFIPQSLLRGFSAGKTGSKAQVTVYPYERPAFRTATDGIAASRNFYSALAAAGEPETLDDRITAHESGLARKLRDLQTRADRSNVEGGAAAELVTHLVIRNDNFRKTVNAALTRMFEAFDEASKDRETSYRMMGLHLDAPSADFMQSLEASWEEKGALLSLKGIDKKSFIDIMFTEAKGNWNSLHAGMAEQIGEAFSLVANGLSAMTSDAQKRVLSASLVPEKWKAHLSAFAWEVREESDIILPDSVAIAFDAHAQATPLVLSDKDECTAIALPLSMDRYLYGSKGDAAWDGAGLHDHLAGCAWDFFVASGPSEQHARSHSLMRRAIEEFIESNVGGILAETIPAA